MMTAKLMAILASAINVDYMKVLEFPSGTADGESQCADIFIIDDSEDEEELFSVELSLLSGTATVKNAIADIFITDNEGSKS